MTGDPRQSGSRDRARVAARTRQSILRGGYLLVVLLFLLGASPLSGQPQGTALQPATVQELQKKALAGQEIDGRVVQADTLAAAVHWLNQQPRPAAAPPPELRISNSIVRGKVSASAFLAPPAGLSSAGGEKAPSPPWMRPAARKESISVELVFAGVTFEDDVDLSDATFEESVSFAEVTFARFAAFDRAVFQKSLFFGETTFRFSAGFAETEVPGAAWFWLPTFHGPAMFREANLRKARFQYPRFKDLAEFSKAQLEDLWLEVPVFEDTASFEEADFGHGATFLEVSFQKKAFFNSARTCGPIQFLVSTFGGDALFQNLHGNGCPKEPGSIDFYSTEFKERLQFDRTKLSMLQMSANPIKPGRDLLAEDTSVVGMPPAVFRNRTSFRGIECSVVDLGDAEFRGSVDFTGARISKVFNLKNVIFEQDVNFTDAQFPQGSSPHSGILLQGADFQKGAILEWDQIHATHVVAHGDTWKGLAQALDQAGNVDGHNEAMYRARVLQRSDSQGWDQLADRAERSLWGYGFRPLRLLGWIGFTFVVFTAIYWTQVWPVDQKSFEWERFKSSLVAVLQFSAATAWKISYGYQHARTPLFKFITVLQSTLSKILFLLLFRSLANTSPLLNELISKLIPI